MCILLALITFTFLTITSGSKGVLITDTIMFGLFTIATIVGAFIIVKDAGGWTESIQAVTKINPDIFSWHIQYQALLYC